MRDHLASAITAAALAGCLCAASSGAAAESQNLLFSPGFEADAVSATAGARELPVGWLLYPSDTTATVRLDATRAAEGRHSLLLETGADAKAILVSDPLAVAPGETLRLRARCMTGGMTTRKGGTLALTAAFLDADRRYFVWRRAAPQPPAQTNEWTTLATEATVPAGAAYVTFQFGVYHMTGKTWWDALELTTDAPVAARLDASPPSLEPGTTTVALTLLNRDRGPRARSVIVLTRPGGARIGPLSLAPQSELRIAAPFQLAPDTRVSLSAAITDAATGAVLYTAEARATVPPLLATEPAVPTHFCVEDGTPALDGRLWIHAPQTERAELALVCSLRKGRETLDEWRSPSLPQNPVRYELSSTAAAPGDYRIDITLTRGAATVTSATLDWHVIRRAQSHVTIGADGFLRADGQPFFPLGIFNGGRFAEQAAAGFNVTHGYNALATKPGQIPDNTRAKRFLDDSAAAGMKTLMLVTHGSHSRDADDEFVHRVRMFKNHPALLAWDEEEGIARGEMPLANLERMREILSREAPEHPFVVGDSRAPVAKLAGRSEFFPDTLMDAGMWWWYPFPLTPAANANGDAETGALEGNEVASALELAPPEFLTAAKTRKPLWVGVQAYRKPNRADGRFPTRAEYRAQAYLAVIHGAKGLMYYVGSGSEGSGILNSPEDGDWEYLKRLAAELREMSPVFTSPDAPHAVRIEPSDAPISLRLKTAPGGGLVLLAANRSLRATRAAMRVSDQPDGAANVRYENRRLAIASGALADEFAPLGVHLYDLPTP